jgi:hypothetical protein
MEPQEYYQQGQIDHDRGMPMSSNPYAWGTVEQASWARGWKHAETKKREARRAAYQATMASDDDDDIPF